MSNELGKTIAYALRHKPEKLGVVLDKDGWTSVADLLAGLAAAGLPTTLDELKLLVAEDDKQRYTLSDDGERIRAAQGHSAVRISYQRKRPPRVLYHGTHQDAVESIEKSGLNAGRRHYVHLSATIETAETVGERRGEPVVFEVAAAQLDAAGHNFYQAENGVWLTTSVPAAFLTQISGPSRKPRQ